MIIKKNLRKKNFFKKKKSRKVGDIPQKKNDKKKKFGADKIIVLKKIGFLQKN